MSDQDRISPDNTITMPTDKYWEWRKISNRDYYLIQHQIRQTNIIRIV